jgi:hypothetical protein
MCSICKRRENCGLCHVFLKSETTLSIKLVVTTLCEHESRDRLGDCHGGDGYMQRPIGPAHHDTFRIEAEV